MGVENWLPREGEGHISARVPKELADFVDEIAMMHACNRTEAICKILEYARGCDEIYRWITSVRKKGNGNPCVEVIQMAMDNLSRLSNPFAGNWTFPESKRMAKEKRQLNSRIEQRISPAIIDASRAAGRITAVFQPDAKIDNRIDEGGLRTVATDDLRFGGSKKKATSEEAAERATFSTVAGAGGAPTTVLASSESKITTAANRAQLDRNVKRRAKKRGVDTIMSGAGYAPA